MTALGMTLTLEGQAKLKSMLEQDESYRQFPYKDINGIETIGIGRNLKANGINHDEAMYLLQTDIRKAEHELITNWPYYEKLDEPRQIALVNMCFAMGCAGLMGFKEMLGFIQASNWEAASKALLNSEWARVVKNRAQRLAYILEMGRF